MGQRGCDCGGGVGQPGALAGSWKEQMRALILKLRETGRESKVQK